tara:strand:- start:1227 stop:1475 length:249 start_codon:yes stop_codon:yes gene_type:complete
MEKHMKNWTTWIPLLIAILISICANLYPILMAFVIEADGWVQAGWVLYFFLLPASLALIVVGWVLSLIIFFVRRRADQKTEA